MSVQASVSAAWRHTDLARDEDVSGQAEQDRATFVLKRSGPGSRGQSLTVHTNPALSAVWKAAVQATALVGTRTPCCQRSRRRSGQVPGRPFAWSAIRRPGGVGGDPAAEFPGAGLVAFLLGER